MMLSVAFAAFTLLAGEAARDAGIQAFGEACLANPPMSRDGLAALARQKAWPQGEGDTPEEMEWRDVYRVGEAIVHLDQHRVSDTNPGERICVVLVGTAPSNWADQVSDLHFNGARVGAPASYDAQKYELPPGLDLVVWDLPDGGRIHALKTPDNVLEVSVNYPVAQ